MKYILYYTKQLNLSPSFNLRSREWKHTLRFENISCFIARFPAQIILGLDILLFSIPTLGKYILKSGLDQIESPSLWPQTVSIFDA